METRSGRQQVGRVWMMGKKDRLAEMDRGSAMRSDSSELVTGQRKVEATGKGFSCTLACLLLP